MSSVPRSRSPAPQSEPVKLVAATDFAVALGLPVVAAVSWTVPEHLWRGVSRIWAPFYAPMLCPEPGALKERIQSLLGGREVGGAAHAIVEELIREDIEASLQLLRDYAPGGWRPAIQLLGEQHVSAALERGHGVILWVGHFVHGSLVTKMAFHRAGFAVSHLSHPRHGFSSTRLGMRVLNRVRTAIEDRYLRERVLLSLDGSTGAMKLLHRRLREGGVVSISVRGTARRPLSVPFLDGDIRLAAGAPNLAYATGAALLPVFTIRDESGGFTVTAEPPLAVTDRAARGEALERAVGEYVALLESYVLKFPGQWLGWLHP